MLGGAFQRKWVSHATLTKVGAVSCRGKIVFHRHSTYLAERQVLLPQARTSWWAAFLGQVLLKRLETVAEVCEAKNIVGILFLNYFLIFLEFDLITTVLDNTKDFRITGIALLTTLVLLYHEKSSRTLHHCHTLKFHFSFSASLPFSTEFELLMAWDFEKSRRTTLVFGLSLVPFSPFICMCGICFFLFAGTLFHHIAV